MINRYRFGTPIQTGAVVKQIPYSDVETLNSFYFSVEQQTGAYVFTVQLKKLDKVYGLGEQVRGINKRGWIYTSDNEDDPVITDTRTSLYCAHNFISVNAVNKWGAFFDFPAKVVFDIGYTDTNFMTVKCYGDGDLYIIENDDLISVSKEFRSLIGRSYIPPRWAFGIGQSRWGYKTADEIREVVAKYEGSELPLDMVYMDIDYMKDYQDFTINEERFPDFKNFVEEMLSKGVRLIPIVDAAIKVKDDYSIYSEGVEKQAFCVDKKGKPYVVGVWPGDSVLPDVLNDEAAEWFGSKYKFYLDYGIEGFWNDMNEPALFYSKKRLKAVLAEFKKADPEMTIDEFNYFNRKLSSLKNNREDFTEFYHTVDGEKVRHDKVHNLYGYKLTECSSKYLQKYQPKKRHLIFSRSSYIGMHRYGGVWTGDNSSSWHHLLLNLQMLPGLNMCGFLYSGADIGGFASHATEDLLLRWMALAVFTPLYRNHSTNGSRYQEPYNFKAIDKFRQLMKVRYALLPFVYSEFVKCALSDDLLFKPMSFVFPDDKRSLSVEDQLIMGGGVMICPVYEQNAPGRYVYLPEDMLEVRFTNAGIKTKQRKNGNHYVSVLIDQVVFFLRKGYVIPVAKPQNRVGDVDFENVDFIKNIDKETEYTLCIDDGTTTDDLSKYLKTVKVKP